MTDETVIPSAATEAPPATETPAAQATPEPTPEAAALAAMDEGIAEASPEPVAPVAEPETPAAAKPDAAPVVPGDADAAKAAAEQPKPEEAVEAEIKGFALKEKAAERFRELSGQAKEYAPIREALTKAGVTDTAKFVEQVPQLLQRSKDFEDIVGMVTATGADAEQYSAALTYLTDANKAMQGDVAAAKRAYAQWQQQGQIFAGILGVDAAGVDPLAAHADLMADVENGELSRPRALEIAAARTQGAMGQQHRQQAEQASAHEQAATQGRQSLNTLGEELARTDPDYARKQPYLLPALQAIVQGLPPDKWAEAARNAYARIPALPAAAPVAAKPPVGPIRASGPRPTLTPTTDDPLEAMNLGIAAVG